MSDRLFNLLEVDVERDARSREGNEIVRTMLGQRAGAEETGFSVYELAPGQKTWAYHYELCREEWLIAISGEVVVRTPGSDVTMRPGDVRCFPIGPEGAHQVRNDSPEPARYAMPSSFTPHAYAAIYPDTNKALIGGPHFRQIVSLDETLEYWDLEP